LHLVGCIHNYITMHGLMNVKFFYETETFVFVFPDE
jgi:hypothetical protein